MLCQHLIHTNLTIHHPAPQPLLPLHSLLLRLNLDFHIFLEPLREVTWRLPTHFPVLGGVSALLLSDLAGASEDTSDEVGAAESGHIKLAELSQGHEGKEKGENSRIIVRRNRVCNPRWVTIRINDTNRRHSRQSTLMETDIILQRVQDHHQIRLDRPVILQVLANSLVLNHLIPLIDDLNLRLPQDLIAVRQAPRNPAIEKMASACKLGSTDNSALLALARADEQDRSAVVGYAFYDLCCAAQVHGRGFKGDDVDSRADAVDVPLVPWVPQRGGMAHVGLRREEEGECDLVWPNGSGDGAVGLVEGGDV